VNQALPQAAAAINEHDLTLLWLGAGVGASLLLIAWLLLEIRDDKRRARRELTPVPARSTD
jgi:hypothetical protein